MTAERLSIFLNYAKMKTPELVPVPLHETLSDILNLLKFDFDEKKITVQNDVPDISIYADKEMLTQVISNIVLNSINALPLEGRFSVTGIVSGKWLELQFKDNGSGISDSLLANLKYHS